jgi:hypothetical protein
LHASTEVVAPPSSATAAEAQESCGVVGSVLGRPCGCGRSSIRATQSGQHCLLLGVEKPLRTQGSDASASVGPHAAPKVPQEHKSAPSSISQVFSLFVWLVTDGWCWFVLREKYCWLIADGWFVVRKKYCWLVADKPNEQGVCCLSFVGVRYRRAVNLYRIVCPTRLVSARDTEI